MSRKDLVLMLAALALALGVAAVSFWSSAVPTGSWGLSFRQEGEPPIGNAGVDQLGRFHAAYLGDPQEKVVYLTFDAGYENGYTARILDTLRDQEVKAAFFLVGDYLERCPDLVRRMAEEGHTVGNHTMTHPDMSHMGEEAFLREIRGVEELYRQITGTELSKYYRPPRGLYSLENLELANKLGYRTVFWSLAHVDWKNDAQPTRQQALDKLLPRLHNGAVILLHSSSRTNCEILEEFIRQAKAQGYRFAPLPELFGE